jgi:hypothetical protein
MCACGTSADSWLFNLAGLLSKRLPPALLGGSGFTTALLIVFSFSTGFKPTADTVVVDE